MSLQAQKALKYIKGKDLKLLKRAIDELARDPYAKSNVRKLTYKSGYYRLRVSRWRVIYLILTFRKELWIENIFMRKEDDDYERRLKAVLFL